MNDLKRITHELAMQFAVKNSDTPQDFVGTYISTVQAMAYRIPEVDKIFKDHKEYND